MKTKKLSVTICLLSLISLLLLCGCWGSNEAKEVSVRIGTDLPKEISTLSISDQSPTKVCEITAITAEKAGSEYVILLSGTKKFDKGGEDVSSSCFFTWELCDESNSVVSSGMGNTPELKSGEAFTDVELIRIDAASLPSGTYTFKIGE